MIAAQTNDTITTLDEARRYAERIVLRKALTAGSGSIHKAAEILQCSRPTVYDLIKRLDMAEEVNAIQVDAYKEGTALRAPREPKAPVHRRTRRTK